MINLWSIFIPGPGEYHPAPSKEIAQHMAQAHNAAMAAFFERHPESADMAHMSTAAVKKWPFEPEDHAEEIKSFDYAGWGLEGGAA